MENKIADKIANEVIAGRGLADVYRILKNKLDKNQGANGTLTILTEMTLKMDDYGENLIIDFGTFDITITPRGIAK
jgi:hypothetical protein